MVTKCYPIVAMVWVTVSFIGCRSAVADASVGSVELRDGLGRIVQDRTEAESATIRSMEGAALVAALNGLEKSGCRSLALVDCPAVTRDVVEAIPSNFGVIQFHQCQFPESDRANPISAKQWGVLLFLRSEGIERFAFPPEHRVHQLTIASCDLEHLPSWLRLATTVSTLEIKGCEVASFDVGLLQGKRLDFLVIKNNRIDAFLVDEGVVVAARNLDASGNTGATLPRELVNARGVDEVFVKGSVLSTGAKTELKEMETRGVSVMW